MGKLLTFYTCGYGWVGRIQILTHRIMAADNIHGITDVLYT